MVGSSSGETPDAQKVLRIETDEKEKEEEKEEEEGSTHCHANAKVDVAVRGQVEPKEELRRGGQAKEGCGAAGAGEEDEVDKEEETNSISHRSEKRLWRGKKIVTMNG